MFSVRYPLSCSEQQKKIILSQELLGYGKCAKPHWTEVASSKLGKYVNSFCLIIYCHLKHAMRMRSHPLLSGMKILHGGSSSSCNDHVNQLSSFICFSVLLFCSGFCLSVFGSVWFSCWGFFDKTMQYYFVINKVPQELRSTVRNTY